LGLAAFVPTIYVDLRPLEVDIPNLDARSGTLLAMPFADKELASLSCLHVAEHVGLGRYGDPLDPLGTVKAAGELARILAPGGRLWFGLPVGRPRTNFNAHRVHDPRDVPGMFPGLELEHFAGVDDAGAFHPTLTLADLAAAEWGCGLYRFTRPTRPANRPDGAGLGASSA
jgi:SAM-dependent methyltransferase